MTDLSRPGHRQPFEPRDHPQGHVTGQVALSPAEPRRASTLAPLGKARTSVILRPVRLTYRMLVELILRLVLAASIWVVYDDQPAGDPTLVEVVCGVVGAYQLWTVCQILTFGRNGSTQLEFDHDGFIFQQTWRRSFVVWQSVTGIDIRGKSLLTGRSPGLLVHRADAKGPLDPVRIPNVFALTPEQLGAKLEQLHRIAVGRARNAHPQPVPTQPTQIQHHRRTAPG